MRTKRAPLVLIDCGPVDTDRSGVAGSGDRSQLRSQAQLILTIPADEYERLKELFREHA